MKKFAYTTKPGDVLKVHDKVIPYRQGLVKASGAKYVELKRVGHVPMKVKDKKHPEDSWRPGGVYFVLTADKQIDKLYWDNKGYDGWIQSGHEAALRLMQCKHALVKNVKFDCVLQANGQPWKQVGQRRSDGPDHDNGDGEQVYESCIFRGPTEDGRQQDSGGKHQKIGVASYINCYMTHWPQRKAGVRRQVVKGCKKIRFDQQGNMHVVGDWPEQVD